MLLFCYNKGGNKERGILTSGNSNLQVKVKGQVQLGSWVNINKPWDILGSPS